MKDSVECEKKALELLSHHENIIGYEGYGEDDESYNFVLEYCPHGSLEKFMKQFEVVPIELVRYYTAQIVQTLEFLHNEHNYLHRDLKPQNFAIDKNFRIKLIDFGESKQIDSNRDLFKYLDVPQNDLSDLSFTNTLTPGDWVGTLVYRSPELVTHDISSPAMDLWALGCTLFYMLTKELPF